MAQPDLTTFCALLFDMHGTFMFGHDRMGDDEDFCRTYRAIGGRELNAAALQRAVAACCSVMQAAYDDPARQDSFPGVLETLRQLDCTAGMPRAELVLIADVIGRHEAGRVPGPYRAHLKRLSASHRLGIVSNIWSDKRHWIYRLAEQGLLDLFDVLVFSSDGPLIKPSPALFAKAIGALGIAPERILFVGDDPFRDILGANAAGLRTLLVGEREANGITADWTLPTLLDLSPPPTG